eukprot:m.755361 g.755361  ORF g.755361 m.755361 type:complete len:124 (+) comp23179_c1_seq27:2820-3191(+)
MCVGCIERHPLTTLPHTVHTLTPWMPAIWGGCTGDRCQGSGKSTQVRGAWQANSAGTSADWEDIDRAVTRSGTKRSTRTYRESAIGNTSGPPTAAMTSGRTVTQLKCTVCNENGLERCKECHP